MLTINVLIMIMTNKAMHNKRCGFIQFYSKHCKKTDMFTNIEKGVKYSYLGLFTMYLQNDMKENSLFNNDKNMPSTDQKINK